MHLRYLQLIFCQLKYLEKMVLKMPVFEKALLCLLSSLAVLYKLSFVIKIDTVNR